MSVIHQLLYTLQFERRTRETYSAKQMKGFICEGPSVLYILRTYKAKTFKGNYENTSLIYITAFARETLLNSLVVKFATVQGFQKKLNRFEIALNFAKW